MDLDKVGRTRIIQNVIVADAAFLCTALVGGFFLGLILYLLPFVILLGTPIGIAIALKTRSDGGYMWSNNEALILSTVFGGIGGLMLFFCTSMFVFD